MKILEICSATESFSNVGRERGYEKYSIDIEEKFKPDLCEDIMKITPDMILSKFGRPDIIWASSPCTRFSVCSIGKNWNKDGTPKTEQAKKDLLMIKHIISIINELKPKFYFIENPRGMLRRFMPKENRHEVTYCQYGDTRMKPTDIWTNLDTWKARKCNNGDKCHESAPRGSRKGTQGLKNNVERGRIPKKLCEEILIEVEKHGNSKQKQ